jgi:hypothetical protein
MERSEGDMSLKKPVKPPGIDPGTVRLVAQRLNLDIIPGPFSQGTRNKQCGNPQELCQEPTSRVLLSHIETRTAVGNLTHMRVSVPHHNDLARPQKYVLTSVSLSHCCCNKNDVTTTSLQLPQCALLVPQIRCQVPCNGIAARVPVTWLERRRCITLQVPEFLCGVKAAVAYIWWLIRVYCRGSELYFSHICLYGFNKENCTFFVYQRFCGILPLVTTSACNCQKL